jgi:subtilase family serine protease
VPYACAFRLPILLGVALFLPGVAQAERDRKVCGPEVTGFARCFALVEVNAKGTAAAAATPTGLNPVDLRSAYALTTSTTAGTGKTIAIVDAFDDPNAAANLSVYRAQFGIPACTTTSGCFRKVDQNGGTTYPGGNVGWGQEISLDLDMASAICPNCKILLVEARTSSIANLGTAVNTAARLGATVISNSYGGGEFSAETSYETAYYHHPGIAVVASSGDSGFGVQFPAASRYVTAVGGTTLNRATNARGWSETAWSGAGSGCSAFEPKPTWQHDVGCARRSVADVSADADPRTGVSVYDTYGSGGWLKFGGTSVAAPIIGGVYALNGAPATFGSNPYAHPTALFDVIGGSNGSCGGSYLCTAVAGYDGPTGLGTPRGAGAF